MECTSTLIQYWNDISWSFRRLLAYFWLCVRGLVGPATSNKSHRDRETTRGDVRIDGGHHIYFKHSLLIRTTFASIMETIAGDCRDCYETVQAFFERIGGLTGNWPEIDRKLTANSANWTFNLRYFLLRLLRTCLKLARIYQLNTWQPWVPVGCGGMDCLPFAFGKSDPVIFNGTPLLRTLPYPPLPKQLLWSHSSCAVSAKSW